MKKTSKSSSSGISHWLVLFFQIVYRLTEARNNLSLCAPQRVWHNFKLPCSLADLSQSTQPFLWQAPHKSSSPTPAICMSWTYSITLHVRTHSSSFLNFSVYFLALLTCPLTLSCAFLALNFSFCLSSPFQALPVEASPWITILFNGRKKTKNRRYETRIL